MRRKMLTKSLVFGLLNVILDTLFRFRTTVPLGIKVANLLGNSIEGTIQPGLRLRGWNLKVEPGGNIGQNVRVDATTAVVVQAGATVADDEVISTRSNMDGLLWHTPQLVPTPSSDTRLRSKRTR